MKAVHFGAGNIGRGFIGAVLSQSGYETVFVDVNKTVIQALNERNEYEVELAGTNEVMTIKGVTGLHSTEDEEQVVQAIIEADLITTAVGPSVLPVIAPILAKGLVEKATSANVIACENMIGGSAHLKEYVDRSCTEEEARRVDQFIGFPNAAVDRIVPIQHNADPLTVQVEPYFEWVIEQTGVRGNIASIQGVKLVDDLLPYIERKLFTVNTGHAAIAYLGAQYGFTTIKQAVDHEEIETLVRETLREAGDVIIQQHGFDRNQHQNYVNNIIDRFKNPDISDEVTRVGRSPIRKLGRDERLVRPAVEYMTLFNQTPDHLVKVITAALQYKDPHDAEAVKLQKLIESKGILEAFVELSGLEFDHPIVKQIGENV